MTISRRAVLAGGAGLVAVAGSGMSSSAFDGPLSDIVEGSEEFWLAVDAYIYGYPLVTMEMTRRVITNVRRARGHQGPDGPDHQAARISGRILSAT